MGFTGCNFVVNPAVVGNIFSGSATVGLPAILPLNPIPAGDLDAVTGWTIVDRVLWDLALLASVTPGPEIPPPTIQIGGFPRNGAVLLNLGGTTAVNLDLTSTSTSAGVSATGGDVLYANWNSIVLVNLGIYDVTVGPGASNGARLLGITSGAPLTLRGGGVMCLNSPAGEAIDSTHRILTIAPATGGLVAVSIGGS
jgi:hypothetical protein